MLKQFRSNVILFFLVNLFVLPSLDVYGQSVTAGVVNGQIIVSSRPVQGKKNKHTATASISAKAKNAATKETTTIEVRETATANSEKKAIKKATKKARKKFLKAILKFFGLAFKKDSDDQVMLDPDGNADYKGGIGNGLGGLIITLGPGGAIGDFPKEGATGSETFIYKNVEEFNTRANIELDEFIEGITLSK